MTKSNTIKRLAIICGGTGGHFYPGLTIARIFQNDKSNKACLFVGGHKVKSQHENAEKYGVDIKEVESARISKHPIKLAVFCIKLLKGYLWGKKLLKEFKPDAVLAMGSFTSVPISLAAVRLKIPLYLHDGNARIGRANLFLSRWAKLIMTAFPSVNYEKLGCPFEYTGMPLRPEILNSKLSKSEAVKELNQRFNSLFELQTAILLVFGGSQGAATINRVIPKTIPTLNAGELQVIHLAGRNSAEEIKGQYDKNNINNLVLESSDNMPLLYSASDFVICRSGGSTIAELAFFEKPAILIPYPQASDLHQHDNAKFYEKSGLAEIVNNRDCTEEKMKQLIAKYISRLHKGLFKSLINLKKLNATEEIIEKIKKKLF